MALAPLAVASDLEARGVTVDPSEAAVLDVFLDVASSIVRDAAGSPISQATSTVSLVGGLSTRLSLPGLPVQSVSAVSVDGVAVTDWKLVSGALFRAAGWCASGSEPCDVEATYTHGLVDVPADIVDLVCRMAAQALVKHREVPGESIAARPVIQERIGDYSVTYAYELAYSEMELPKYLRRRLAARFGSGVKTAVSW